MSQSTKVRRWQRATHCMASIARLRAFVCLASGLMLAGAAQAQSNPVVVELFTSQGCSSCPPADEIMVDLAQRDGVIALAFHVDYWDYIGWRDSFGSPDYTERQTAYARAAQSTSVYTPQFIVGGVDPVVGARAMELIDLIDAHESRQSGVSVTVERGGEGIVIRAEAAAVAPMTVQLVRYAPMMRVAIESGENAGRTLDYANTVMGWQILTEWDGAAPLSLSVPIDGDWRSVVLIQQVGAGPIVASARLD